MNRRQLLQTLLEIALILAVFVAQGARPVPDSNEAHYLGKAIHYWNPDWVGHDFFFDSKDAHAVFYFTFGWLALLLPKTTLAWVGRVVAWALMAWGWQRLNVAVLPRPWWSILTAAMLIALNFYFNLAGEWPIGGIEARGFAYALVFFGLARLVRGQWNLGFVFFGAAAAFHVLIGGWTAVAAAAAWLLMPKDRPPLRSLWPGLLGGLLLSLPGLLPGLALNWGVEREIVRQADLIYVFQRLPHHLAPTRYVTRFVVMVALWLTLCWLAPPDRPLRRLQAIVAASLGLVLVGATIGVIAYFYPTPATSLLRFYWFRLANVAIPMGIGLATTSYLARALRDQPVWGRAWLAFTILMFGAYVQSVAVENHYRIISDTDRITEYPQWRNVCQWIAEPKNIPPGARFLTPPMYRTFKWHAGHSEVVTWKDIPQDARSIVEWWSRLEDVHALDEGQSLAQWQEWLGQSDPEHLRQLGRKYQADYLLTAASPPLNLPLLYKNPAYAVYRLSAPKAP